MYFKMSQKENPTVLNILGLSISPSYPFNFLDFVIRRAAFATFKKMMHQKGYLQKILRARRSNVSRN